MAGSVLDFRKSAGAILCALLAGPFCLNAKAQAIQPQTGSSGQTQPAQPQAQPAQNPPPDQSQNKPAQNNQKPAPQKKIKAHVVKLDKKKKPEEDTSQSAEPDKVLYERAMFDIKKGRYTEGRLSLQSLINTYPDSEYLAKAKLGVADSYYKEGGTSNLTQAIDEYKNFIIFFPFLDEAAYAQMQIGMGHLRMMEKSDRDSTQAQEAEQEFQTFLLKYPQSPLVPKAEQNLRNVQEVLADGEYRIARFYFLKQDYPASAARLIEVSERYPLYSQSDEALWMLGDVYTRAKRASRNEDDKNHWADLAGKCYARIVQDYPLSRLGPDAKLRLKAMGMAVPEPEREAVARMKKEQMYEKEHGEKGVLRFPMGMLKSGPSFAEAAHSGPPNLNPPNDAVSAREVLIQGAKGPDFEQAQKGPEEGNPNASGDTSPVDAVSAPTSAVPQGGTGVGVQIITPSADASSQAPAQAPPGNPTSGTAGSTPAANPPEANAATASNPPPNPPATAAVQGGTAAPDPPVATNPGGGVATQADDQTKGQATPNATSQNPQANAQTNGQKTAKSDKTDPSTESSSKKKKGIKKIIPW
jgi:outer membrane protein assembly factor BamD